MVDAIEISERKSEPHCLVCARHLVARHVNTTIEILGGFRGQLRQRQFFALYNFPSVLPNQPHISYLWNDLPLHSITFHVNCNL